MFGRLTLISSGAMLYETAPATWPISWRLESLLKSCDCLANGWETKGCLLAPLNNPLAPGCLRHLHLLTHLLPHPLPFTPENNGRRKMRQGEASLVRGKAQAPSEPSIWGFWGLGVLWGGILLGVRQLAGLGIPRGVVRRLGRLNGAIDGRASLHLVHRARRALGVGWLGGGLLRKLLGIRGGPRRQGRL
jgi:hypothetical protein